MSDTNDQPDSATQPSLLFAFVLFGLGSWIAVNGIYQELPLIAQTAPEGYDIFSYATVAISLANVVPASYLLAVSRLSTASRTKADHIAIIGFVGVGGIGICFLLGKFWDQIYEIAGARHSVPLIGFIFGAGSIDCLTSVLFYPVLQDFEPEAVAAMQLGEAATGLVGALLATVQENTDGYTVSKSFYTLAGLMGLPMAGYWWVYSKRLTVLLQRQVAGGPPSGQSEPPSACEQAKGFEEDPLTTNRLVVFSEDIPYTNGTDAVDGQLPQSPEPSYPRRKKPLNTHVQIWKFMVAQAVLAFLENGLHTTVLPSCFALYPDTQDMVSAAVKGGYGAAALVTILAHFRAPQMHQLSIWGLLYGVSYACGVWMLIVATRDVSVGSRHMGAFNVFVTIVLKCTIGYTKTSLFIRAQEQPNCGKVLRLSGVGVQIGSLIGSLLFFQLGVVSKVFH